MQGALAKGVLTEAQARQLRAAYGGKLTMIDHWFGKILDAVDRHKLWDDTLFVLCTDHGHYLGEKDIWGKPGVPVYETLGRIPLLISHPAIAPGQCDALTTSVDLFATLADVFGVEVRQRTHGRSLLPLLRGEVEEVRDWVLTGVWGREVHLVDKRYKYARAPRAANAPLTMLSNRWSTMPTHFLTREQELPLPDDRAYLSRMPGSDVPVIRQDWHQGDKVPFWAATKFSGNHLYALDDDPGEERNLAGTPVEEEYAERLHSILRELEVPESQFTRLGFAST
jgi:arylsulfatase A-like enzyme